MAIKVKASIRTEEVQWQGSDLVIPFVVEPLGLPALGGSFVVAAGGLNSAQLVGQFKTQLITFIGQQVEYSGLGSIAPTELVILGAFE